MGQKEEGISYDKILQFIAPFAWIVLSLLGWSLDRQVTDFQSKISVVENSLTHITNSNTELVTGITEIRVRSIDTAKDVERLAVTTEQRGNQIERLTAIVNQSLEVKRSLLKGENHEN